MSQPDTKQRILDAAESLFAREGFHNTSLRAITGRAGANLAAVNYHFGSKDALAQAVLERRLTPLNEARRGALEQVRQQARGAGRPPGVEETLRAFIEPTLAFRESGPGARDFISLVGRALGEPDGALRSLFMQLMQPTFQVFFEVMREALPQQPAPTVFWRMVFALGSMGQTLCLLDKPLPLPPGIEPTRDSQTLLGLMIPFLAAGMEAPCA
ncbi:TetR family transcriptional regulator [Desulfuromonas versatilis]|uniref:TetR family transcriptional regulator n=1 Tax=Desulfuromonas versatilis TaxID=2802975 RepID=A0ABM8HSL3_9BACT|nr:TetR/AcrR family transcriptional regulator [Desulfuromonas versatilis]BCR03645.1 TetR family transcriptional regulator [Desulfuromonas versatilis]